MRSTGAPRTCAHCDAILFEPWYDWKRQAYDCRHCHRLTDKHGQPLEGEGARHRSFERQGIILVGMTILIAAALGLALYLR